MAGFVAKAEIVVLGLLTEKPMHGYDLLERYRARSMGSWVEVAKASVYQALKRLERDGAIKGRALGGTRGPDRRVFTITEAGRRRLRQGMAERIDSRAPFETDAGVALGFANLLPSSQARDLIDARERSLRELMQALAAELDRIAREGDAGVAISAAMLRRQAILAEAELGWLRAFRSSMAKKKR